MFLFNLLRLTGFLLAFSIQWSAFSAAPSTPPTRGQNSPVQSLTLPAPTLRWQTTIGGNGSDDATALASFADSTYIAAGSTASTYGDMAKDPLAGNVQSSAWVAKLNRQGNKLWFKSYALFPAQSSSNHGALSVAPLVNGGCVVAAKAISDVVSQKNSPWVFKLDATGQTVWQETFHESSTLEYFTQTVAVDSDSNYVVAGWVKKPGNAGLGLYDVWVIKLNSNGELIWEKTFGGSSNELPSSIIALPEGGCVIAGYTASRDGDVTATQEGFNCWILKLDANGTLIWQKTYGGSYDDRAMSIARTGEGSFVVAGYTSSGDGNITGYHGPQPPRYGNTFFGLHDFWVLKLGQDGRLLWQKALGGFQDDVSASVTVTDKDEYIVAGSTESADGDVTGYHPPANAQVRRTDFWVLKLSSSGVLVWQKAYGGSMGEDASAVLPTADGGCLVAGRAESSTGDVETNRGYSDAWIIRLAGPVPLECTTLSNGIWSAASTWSCGRIPTITDVVRLRHVIAIPANYKANAQQLIYEAPVSLQWSTGSRLLLGQ